MQKARRHHPKMAPTACRQTGSGSFSLLCSRCFSPFPHGTGSLSVSREYLALRDGPRCFSQDFSCPAILRIPSGALKKFVYGVITRSDCSFHSIPLLSIRYRCDGPTTPILPKQHGFGLLRVRSPLLTQSLLFSSPMGTKMFQFPTFASVAG